MSTLTSTRVLVNTGSTLIQAANDEEGVDWWVRMVRALIKSDILTSYFNIFRSVSRLACCKWNREAPSLHKFQQFVNWLQKNCNWKWKFATGNRN